MRACRLSSGCSNFVVRTTLAPRRSEAAAEVSVRLLISGVSEEGGGGGTGDDNPSPLLPGTCAEWGLGGRLEEEEFVVEEVLATGSTLRKMTRSI